MCLLNWRASSHNAFCFMHCHRKCAKQPDRTMHVLKLALNQKNIQLVLAGWLRDIFHIYLARHSIAWDVAKLIYNFTPFKTRPFAVLKTMYLYVIIINPFLSLFNKKSQWKTWPSWLRANGMQLISFSTAGIKLTYRDVTHSHANQDHFNWLAARCKWMRWKPVTLPHMHKL